MTAEDNVRSRQLLLASIDHHIFMMLEDGSPRGLVDSFIMNRNRVAKLFNLPAKRKATYVNEANDSL